MMQDSQMARNKIIQYTDSPLIVFNNHDSRHLKANALAYTYPLSPDIFSKFHEDGNRDALPIKSSPTIYLMPASFSDIGKNGTYMSEYIDTVIHESLHTIESGAQPKDYMDDESYLVSTIQEGLTQYLTFEITQYLAKKYPELEIVSSAGYSRLYDRRLITVAILDSILSADGRNEVFIKWHFFLASDEELLKTFKKAVRDLGLDTSLNDDLYKFYTGNSKESEFLFTLLAKLKLSRVELSEEFLKKLLTNNRALSDGFLEKISQNLDSVTKSVEETEKAIQSSRQKAR